MYLEVFYARSMLGFVWIWCDYSVWQSHGWQVIENLTCILTYDVISDHNIEFSADSVSSYLGLSNTVFGWRIGPVALQIARKRGGGVKGETPPPLVRTGYSPDHMGEPANHGLIIISSLLIHDRCDLETQSQECSFRWWMPFTGAAENGWATRPGGGMWLT